MTHVSSSKLLATSLSILSFGLLAACGGAEAPKDEVGTGGTTTLPSTGGNAAGTGGGTASGGASSGGSGLGASSNGTGGVAVDPAPYCDTATKVSVPYTLTTDYVPSGFMGDIKDITMTADTCPDRPVGAVGVCNVIHYNPTGANGWAGVAWQYPENNWGDAPGKCFDSTAKSVKFKAKGAAGGEKVKFGAAGAETSEIALTTEWTEYTVTLTSDFNLSGTSGGVASGFTWSAAAPDAKVTFYVDDIRWVSE